MMARFWEYRIFGSNCVGDGCDKKYKRSLKLGQGFTQEGRFSRWQRRGRGSKNSVVCLLNHRIFFGFTSLHHTQSRNWSGSVRKWFRYLWYWILMFISLCLFRIFVLFSTKELQILERILSKVYFPILCGKRPFRISNLCAISNV